MDESPPGMSPSRLRLRGRGEARPPRLRPGNGADTARAHCTPRKLLGKTVISISSLSVSKETHPPCPPCPHEHALKGVTSHLAV